MNKIKFSYNYHKLGLEPDKEVCLLQALKVHYKDLSKIFILYDTHYFNENMESEYYKLPETDLILLIFKHGGQIFTTIKRYIPSKWEYYKSQEGNEFKLVIER